MQVRNFVEQDLVAIADIYNQHIATGESTLDAYPYSVEDMKSIVDKFDHRETILVIEKNNQVIGWGSIKHYSPRWGYRSSCETSIYLSSLETGKGYGKILYTQLLKQVRNFSYHHVVAKIRACNQKSIQFHQNFGFSRVGVQKEVGFSQGKWQDIIIMQLVYPDIPCYSP